MGKWLNPAVAILACLIANQNTVAQHTVQPDSSFTDRLLPPDAEGISGADGTLSIDLGAQGSLFIWGDSFIGPVENDRRVLSTKFILGNTATLWNGQTACSLYGGTFEEPLPFIATDSSEKDLTWYWPGDGYIEGQQLYLFMSKYGNKRGHLGPFAFTYQGCDFVVVDRRTMRVQSRHSLLDSNSSVHYGHGVLRVGSYLYLYGSEADNVQFRSEIHVMRFPWRDGVPELSSPQYWDGHRWNRHADSSRALEGIYSAVSEQFSIRQINGKIVLLNQDRYQVPGQIYLYQSTRPEGPFINEQLIHTIQEPELEQDSLFTYNAMMHPQIRRHGCFLVSYNVNTFRDQLAWEKASVYRPRFLWIPLSILE